MATDGEQPEYLPIRTGPSNVEPADSDRVEGSNLGSSDGSTNVGEQPQLTRTSTSRSARERTFEPIAAGDRDELYKIASNFTGGPVHRTSTAGSALERRDTLYGVNIGDPVLDPRSPEFDPYKWSRMYVQFLSTRAYSRA
jgi:ATP-binding cassette, subfamily G (WHITE), member 2, PDR